MGAGTRLVRMAALGRLALDTDRERLLALLSIATNRAVPPAVLTSIEAAAGHWYRGDKALANLRLIFANLPRLSDPGDALRLQQAASLLDGGMTPRALLKALDRDGMDFTHGHYDPDQPRVPAGNGRESGRWGEGAGGGTEGVQWSDGAGSGAQTVRPKPDVFEPRPRVVPVATDGPFKPAGMAVIPLTEDDPLDPKGLRTRLSPQEQKDISDTVDTILAGRPEDASNLHPHRYKNLPDKDTKAQLPYDPGGYIIYYVRSPGSPPGDRRIIRSSAGLFYYTNLHYQCFYPVDLLVTPD